MRISPISVNVNRNIRYNNNQNNNQNQSQKVAFGYGDYDSGFDFDPAFDHELAEQKQTLKEGIEGAWDTLTFPVRLPLAYLHDKATGKLPTYSDLDRLEAEYFDDEEFDEHCEDESDVDTVSEDEPEWEEVL